MVYRGYYYEKNLCVMITHYNVFRRFFRTVYIIAISYEQNMNLQLNFRLFAQLILFFYTFFREIIHIFHSFLNLLQDLSLNIMILKSKLITVNRL